MTYNIIATGSSGNAVIINKRILVDCGVPWRKLEPYAKQIGLVLLTHRHGDHFQPSTVRALHRERPAVRWACCEWMVPPLLEAGVDKRQIDVLTPGAEHAMSYYAALDTFVSPCLLPHNVPNCGWYIYTAGESVFYATDCATLDGITAEGYDVYMIENNHRRDEIEARIAAKRSAGEYAYEEQAARNHLSEEQALDWLARNAGPQSKYVFLHQHKDRQ